MAEACSDGTGDGPASWDSKPSKPWADSKSLAALGPSEESPDPLAGIEGDRCFSLVLGLLQPKPTKNLGFQNSVQQPLWKVDRFDRSPSH